MLQEHSIQVSSYRIRFFQTAQKKKHLLFLHGLGRSPQEYEELLKVLAKHYTVTAPILYGMNEFHPQPRSLEEYVALTDAFCKKLGKTYDVIVGHSTGGAMGLSMSQYAKHIIMINPILPVRYGVAGFIGRAVEIEEAELCGVAGGFHGMILALREEKFVLNALKNLSAELALVYSISKYDFPHMTIKQPTLVLYGLPDEFFQFTPTIEKKLHRVAPAAQVKVLRVERKFRVNHEWPLLYPKRAAYEILHSLGHPYRIPRQSLLGSAFEKKQPSIVVAKRNKK